MTNCQEDSYLLALSKNRFFVREGVFLFFTSSKPPYYYTPKGENLEEKYMLKTKIIEGDRRTFVKELERAEEEGWNPNMNSKNTTIVFRGQGQYPHHSIICQRWEAE